MQRYAEPLVRLMFGLEKVDDFIKVQTFRLAGYLVSWADVNFVHIRRALDFFSMELD